ncbi:MAG: right-handed parallel beta-helix repeat-containing protein, partial [Burkholderiales bacterium]|nr:right-handed parallel beta-helix repeat-containing protein [Burkholderiales bacterium]
LAVGGPAISIATAGVDVSLRNLVIAPLPGGGGTNGVQMTAGNSLTVEGSFLSGLTGTGIFVSGAGLKVVDTTIRVTGSGNGISVWNGARATVARAVISSNTQSAIRVEANAADTTTTASISGSTLEGSFAGLWAQSTHATATLKVAVTGCQVDRTSIGLHAESSAGAPVTLTASNNLVTNTTVWGIYVNGTGAKAWATGNTVTDNVYGFVAVTNGVFESAGNNALRNNGTDQFGTVTVVPMK